MQKEKGDKVVVVIRKAGEKLTDLINLKNRRWYFPRTRRKKGSRRTLGVR